MKYVRFVLVASVVGVWAACTSFEAAEVDAGRENDSGIDSASTSTADVQVDAPQPSLDAGQTGDTGVDPFACLRGADAAPLPANMAARRSCGQKFTNDGGCYKEVDWCLPDGGVQDCSFPKESCNGMDDDCSGIADDGLACGQTKGQLAGNRCKDCGLRWKYYWDEDGGLTSSGPSSYLDFENTPDCVTTELCGYGARFVPVKRPSNTGETCAVFCASIGRTCAETCTDKDTVEYCGAGTLGYRQIECCPAYCMAKGTCGTPIANSANAMNAACCCQ